MSDLVPDSLWERVSPLLPPHPPRRHRFPGRKPVDDRVALAGIVFVLKTGITWNQLPAEVIGCSGVTCWRRLRDWTEAGVWPALHELLLAELRATGQLDLDRCAVDSSHVHALKGRTTSARRRSTASTPGSKHHLIVDAYGIPLGVTLTGGQRHDVTQLLPLLDAVPPIRGLRGRPRHKPRELFADRGYDFDKGAVQPLTATPGDHRGEWARAWSRPRNRVRLGPARGPCGQSGRRYPPRRVTLEMGPTAIAGGLFRGRRPPAEGRLCAR